MNCPHCNKPILLNEICNSTGWRFEKLRTRVVVRDADGSGPLFIIEGGYRPEALAILESLCAHQRGRDSLERVAQAMIRCGLTTGHGDTLDDLLRELEEQVRERRNPKDTARIEWLAERRVIVEEIGRPNVPLFTVQSSVIALRECIDAEAPEIHRIGQEIPEWQLCPKRAAERCGCPSGVCDDDDKAAHRTGGKEHG